MREALQAASDEASGVADARRKHEAELRITSKIRRVAAFVGLAVLAVAGWYVFRTTQAQAAMPLNTGTEWIFGVRGRGKDRITLRIGEPTQFEDGQTVPISCTAIHDEQDTPLGTGYLSNRWLALELVGVTAPFGRHVAYARILPYPFGPGTEWRSLMGKSFVDSQWALTCSIGDAETVSVPAGTFDALPIDFNVGIRGAAPVVHGVWWLAPRVGPVRVQIDEARGPVGSPAMTLDLLKIRR